MVTSKKKVSLEHVKKCFNLNLHVEHFETFRWFRLLAVSSQVRIQFQVFLKCLIDWNQKRLKAVTKVSRQWISKTPSFLSPQIMLRGLGRVPRIWCPLLTGLSSRCLGFHFISKGLIQAGKFFDLFITVTAEKKGPEGQRESLPCLLTRSLGGLIWTYIIFF